MDTSKIYDEFEELTPSKISFYLDDKLKLYEKYIEPIYNELFEKEGDRINILYRLILWDELFYGKYEFDGSRLVGTYRKKQFIDVILSIIYDPPKYKESYRVLNSILGKWPQIRDYFFQSQKDKLDSCTSPDDYITFIESKPYPEYALFAQYKLSLLNKVPFDEAKIAIDKYPNSDILPIKALQSLFQNANGINFMWKGYAANTDLNTRELKESIIKLMSSSKLVNSKEGTYIQTLPVDYSLLRNIIQSGIHHNSLHSLKYELYVHDCINKEPTKDSNAVIANLDLFKNIILLLNSLISGVKFSLPNVTDIQKENVYSIDYLWVNNKYASNNHAVYHCQDGQVYPESKNMYAGCELLINID